MPTLAKASEKSPGGRPGFVLSRRAMIGWVFVLFIVSGWMFGMGVMVGRGTAPVHFDVDQLKRTIEGLQKAARDPQRSGGPVESTEMKDKTKLDFYDMLPKNREDSDLPNLPKPAPPPAPTPRPEPAPRAVEPPAPKPEKPAAPPSPAAAPPPAAASTGKGFTVQVSAVKSEEEARRMLERLRQRGYAGYLEPITTPDKGTLYRVRMGEFPSKEFARSTLDRLQKDGFEPQVVPK
jgi:cell division septation protein DedD